MPIQPHIDYQYCAAISAGGATTRVATLGNNISVDTLTQPEDVWSGAALGTLNGIDHKFIQLPQSPVNMEILSDSANDAAAGSGARTVAITYLNANYQSNVFVAPMNGTTPVALPTQILRINSVVVATSGTFGGNNAGNLSVRLVGGLGATYAYMVAGNGLARNSLYTVPDQLQFDLLSMLVSINRTDTNLRAATFSLCVQNSAGRLIKGLELAITTDSPYRHEAANVPLNVVASRTDIWVRCEAVSNSSTNVTAALFGVQRPVLPFGL